MCSGCLEAYKTWHTESLTSHSWMVFRLLADCLNFESLNHRCQNLKKYILCSFKQLSSFVQPMQMSSYKVENIARSRILCFSPEASCMDVSKTEPEPRAFRNVASILSIRAQMWLHCVTQQSELSFLQLYQGWTRITLGSWDPHKEEKICFRQDCMVVLRFSFSFFLGQRISMHVIHKKINQKGLKGEEGGHFTDTNQTFTPPVLFALKFVSLPGEPEKPSTSQRLCPSS